MAPSTASFSQLQLKLHATPAEATRSNCLALFLLVSPPEKYCIRFAVPADPALWLPNSSLAVWHLRVLGGLLDGSWELSEGSWEPLRRLLEGLGLLESWSSP